MSVAQQPMTLAATHLAVAFLTVATVLACLHGVQVRRLKSKSLHGFWGPSLASIDRAVCVLVACGVSLLACTLAWRPTAHLLVVASLLVFGVYALIRAAGAWHRPRHTLWLLLGSACLVSTCASSAIPHLMVR